MDCLYISRRLKSNNQALIKNSSRIRLCKTFGLDNKKGNRNEDDKSYIYEADDVRLKIYDNGTYLYEINKYGEDMVTVSDKEAIEIAEKFLKNNNLLPEDFEYCGISRDIVQGGKDNKEVEVAKIIYFSRFINGEQVDGNSQVYVMLINDGEINQVYSSFIKNQKKKKVNDNFFIDINEGVENLVNPNNFLDIDESADEISVENIEIEYWEDSSPYSEDNYIQPIYRITGNEYSEGKNIGEFEILTQALKPQEKGKEK
ncbi:MAG: hypothetical protein IJC76_02235 [Lachnospiraceae bacterium]|nr:hypothetical protein [Lachnospiraceae bacterium]